jgi:rubrerythrin
MEKAEIGSNRTGIQASPIDAKKMLETPEGARLTPGDDSGIERLRASYIKESGPVGSVPPPATMKGVAKAGMQALTGKRAQTLIDRLGERLAFERSGTRLYEAMITKCKAAGDGAAQPYLAELEHFCSEEMAHFKLLADCIETLGGDPTAQTPGADVTGVESTGLMQVVTDPMTSVTQSMHAILVAELADNAAWDELIELAQELGQDDLVQKFEGAREEEREHLQKINQWHREATLQESRIGA